MLWLQRLLKWLTASCGSRGCVRAIKAKDEVERPDSQGTAGGCNDSCCGGADQTDEESHGNLGDHQDGGDSDDESTGCHKCDELSGKGKEPCCDGQFPSLPKSCPPALYKSGHRTETCLVRIAVRECHENDEEPGGQPCSRHMASARSRYGHVLEALGCICRVLRGLNIDSCCGASQERGSARTAAAALARSRSCGSQDSWLQARTGRCRCQSAAKCEDECCGNAEDRTGQKVVLDTTSGCAKGCCSGGTEAAEFKGLRASLPTPTWKRGWLRGSGWCSACRA